MSCPFFLVLEPFRQCQKTLPQLFVQFRNQYLVHIHCHLSSEVQQERARRKWHPFFTCFPSTPHAAAGGTDVPDVVGNSDAAEMAKSVPLKDGSQPSGDESSEGLLHSTECKGIAQVPSLLTTTFGRKLSWLVCALQHSFWCHIMWSMPPWF